MKIEHPACGIFPAKFGHFAQEVSIMSNPNRSRLLKLGQVSVITKAASIGTHEELGNYPMLWPF